LPRARTPGKARKQDGHTAAASSSGEQISLRCTAASGEEDSTIRFHPGSAHQPGPMPASHQASNLVLSKPLCPPASAPRQTLSRALSSQACALPASRDPISTSAVLSACFLLSSSLCVWPSRAMSALFCRSAAASCDLYLSRPLSASSLSTSSRRLATARRGLSLSIRSSKNNACFSTSHTLAARSSSFGVFADCTSKSVTKSPRNGLL
jgi:hypothetical protein